MKLKQLSLSIALALSIPAMAADGLITLESDFSVQQTKERLINVLTSKGITIFKEVHHSQSAREVGVELRETELVIFGNPKLGSPLMNCQQSVGIDLPLKALIWEDESNDVWLSYNDIEYIKARHDVAGCEDVLTTMTNALANFSKAAVSESM